MKSILTGLCVLFLAAGCATYTPAGGGSYNKGATRVEYGTITNMVYYQANNSSPISLGSVLGGAAGGLIGHQLGGGTGKTIFTIAGAIAGAAAGSSVQRSVERDRVDITVRLDSGADLIINQVAEGHELRVGDRVRVENNQIYRN